MTNDSSNNNESAVETTNPKRKRTTRIPRQQDIETITKEETLYHIEMAWRAQQRLVRRCLGLRFSEEKEEKDTSR